MHEFVLLTAAMLLAKEKFKNQMRGAQVVLERGRRRGGGQLVQNFRDFRASACLAQ